jgi:uncharacterized membrane protein
MESRNKSKTTVQRIGGYLHKVVPIFDNTGKVISHAVSPLKVELRRRDIMQIIVGASILSVPVAFTQETWDLGRDLPLRNVFILAGISILFIALHVYFNFYRRYLKDHVYEYIKRVLAIYLLSFIIVGVLLTLIEKAPWQQDFLLALKRTIIVTFPASMSAAVSDGID